MKKYTDKQIKDALYMLNDLEYKNQNNIVLEDFKVKLEQEYGKRTQPKFEKATDEYLKTLSKSDTYIRMMEPNDKFYYQGMYGLFQKSTDKLLRRHTDTGFLVRAIK